ncbi:MAG: hypothetical protein IJF37_01505 [Lachnospiraceae bacterium]|nr:hypothetical protein [Lachnospiraceae bacterium]
MSDAFSKITAILLCICMMFIIPVFYMQEESDRLKQTYILEEITHFVDGVRTTGILAMEDYDRMEQQLFTLGGGYSIEMMHCKHMHDESGMEPLYFEDIYYTSQIKDSFMEGENYLLSKNDYLRVAVYDSDKNVMAWYGGSVRYEAY